MEKQHTAESLKEMIAELEVKQARDGQLLKEQLDITLNNLKPINIVKNLLKDSTSSKGLLDEIINTAVSITSGFVTKKIVIGRSKNRFLRLVGMAMQYGITTVIGKKFHSIKDSINKFIESFLGEKEEAKEEIIEEATVEDNKKAHTES